MYVLYRECSSILIIVGDCHPEPCLPRHRGDARVLKQRAQDDIVSVLKTFYSLVPQCKDWSLENDLKMFDFCRLR